MSTTDEIRARDVDSEAGPSMSLVEIEPGVAVVFADRLPDGLDVMPFEMMTPRARQELTDGLAIASGLGNAAAQGIQGAVSPQGEVRKQGSIEREFPLADIRYVRFTEQGKGSPVLDVITKDENLAFTFDDWAHRGADLEKARRLANILAGAMNLPEGERRSDPLLSGCLSETRASGLVDFNA